MNPLATNSPPPPPPVAAPPNPNDHLARRKRGRPRKDETSHAFPQPKEDLVGQRVSGVVEGSFEAGYMLNLKVQDSDKKLKGLVFIPGKVIPVTPENDVAPRVKMYERTQSLPNDDQSMKDVEIAESSQALSLIPYEGNGEAAQAKEDMVEKNVVVEEEEEEEATCLVEFFPTPEMTMTDQPQPNHVLLEKETEQQKSPGETSRGLELMVAEKVVCPGEKVPDMLQLELGNKAIVNEDNNNNNNSVTTEKEPETSEKTNLEETVTKSGFIANLLEGGDKKEDCDMGEGKEATTPLVK